MTLGDLLVKLGSDPSDFNRGMDEAAKKIEDTANRFNRAGKILTASVTVPLMGFAALSIKAAADAEEAANKFNVVMGGAADDLRERLERLHGTIPQTVDEMQALTAQMQDMLVPLGLVRSEAAQMSGDFLELAADIGSFNNVATSEVMEAMQSGMAGMSRPLRKYGIDISDARLQTLMMSDQLRDLAETNKTAARAQAIMMAVQLDSADAMGDAARTVDSSANSFRFLWRSVRDLANAVGTVLLPIVTPMAQSFTRMVNIFRELPTPMQQLIILIGALAAAAGPVLMITALILANIVPLTAAFVTLTGPVGLAIAGFIALAAAGFKYRDHIMNVLVPAVKFLWGVLESIIDVLALVIGIGLAPFLDVWRRAVRIWEGTVLRMHNAIVERFGGIREALVAFGGMIIRTIVGAWETVLDFLRNLPLVNRLIEPFTRLSRFLAEKVSEWYALGSGFVRNLIQGIADNVRNIPGVGPMIAGRIERLLGQQAAVAREAGEKVGEAFNDGVASRFVAPTFDLASAATDGKKGKAPLTELELMVEEADRLATTMGQIPSWSDHFATGMQKAGEMAARLRAMLDATKDPFSDAANTIRASLEDMYRVLSIGIGTLPEREPPVQFTELPGMDNVTRALYRAYEAIEDFRVANSEFAHDLRNEIMNLGQTVDRGGQMLVGAGLSIVSQLSPIGILGTLIGAALERLQPAIDALIMPLVMVAEALAVALMPVLKALFPIVKGFGIAVTWVAEVIFRVVDAIWTGIGKVLEGIGKLLNKLPGSIGNPLIKAGKAMQTFWDGSIDAMKGAREELKDLSWEDALDPLTKSANAASDALSKVPTGYKLLELRAYEAIGAQLGTRSIPMPSPVTAGGVSQQVTPTTQIFNFDIHTRATDGGEILDEVLIAARRRARAIFGDENRWAEI